MATIERISTLDTIREKVEAGERLDAADGQTLFETDDLLGLGELADLARRRRGGDDRVFFIQNLYLEPDERLPREVQVLRVRRHPEGGGCVHVHGGGDRRGRARAA